MSTIDFGIRGPRHLPGESASGPRCVGRSTSARAATLLGKADGLLSAAAGADTAAERFRLAYLAALRGAGAVVAAAELRAPQRPLRRPNTRNAWVLMARADDSFAAWADYFADRSATRTAIEAGVARAVDADRSDEFYDEVGRFLHDVEDYVGSDQGGDSDPGSDDARTASAR
ncbi:SAV_6107 family HEPN domain-containing protein [Rhodococcus coprophilus]|uniref:SAV-6107-like HEPN domain-containing protein n=1 Tax=Rhodococcus coprophilus TaxID=38310 RepID=A0A2X4WN13_9NOCA|nr:SAV_6107 family HEPN domain-containing protein [Rhodococcus coprophilus]MBM7460485.1 hypothetical protein [Rhodococcus coprophilus]SQI28295.1 Uncharacterised protein [Rhodococcus coprophilus]